MIQNRWDDQLAAGLSEPELLRYRSNLLGADLAVTNYGGGNTSAKVDSRDPVTEEPIRVLWVKGSGGDLASLGMDGFATLDLDRLRSLEKRYRGLPHEDEMVQSLQHCTLATNARAPSIDTPLHAYLSFRHIDHLHPDAVTALAATRRGEEIVREIYGEQMSWLPWQRPGFDLALRLRDHVDQHPNCRGVVLGGHGMITWAESSKDCYERSLDIIRQAEAWLCERNTHAVFGAVTTAALPPAERAAVASEILPRIRGRIGQAVRKVGHFCESDDVLELVTGSHLRQFASLGTSCPDHFLRTKIRPLVLDVETARDDAALERALSSYRNQYASYYERCRHPESPPMRDPNAVVYLVPGVGMITFAKDKPSARIAGEFYRNAIHVMRDAAAVDRYVALPEQAAFDIEYWSLEEAKLRRAPRPKPLAGRVALVTGAAGGIGRATAARLLQDDACVVLADHDEDALETAHAQLAEQFSPDQVHAAVCNVTDEHAVAAAFRLTAREFGGLDILVSNAGIASACSIEDTSLAVWEQIQAVLSTGYFLVAREAMRLFKTQGLGGSIVIVASKNALVASPNSAAYNTAKAAEVHLARCIAVEGAEHGIRANVVNPDAVLRGSRIWTGRWKEERAAAHRLEPDQLEEHYRNRSLLRRHVLPEDVAEAVHFFASDRSAKSTGNILNVDAGNVSAFTR